MKLYYSPGACSLASHIILEELNLPYELIRVDLKNKRVGDQDFTKINAKGYIPALLLDNGKLLTEGVAILQYLADQKPSAALAPASGSFERYQLQEWLNYISTELHKGLSIFWNDRVPAEVKDVFREALTKKFTFVDQSLSKSEFLLGANFSVADAYLFNILSWTDLLNIDLKPYANITQFMSRVSSRASVQQALKAEGLLKNKVA